MTICHILRTLHKHTVGWKDPL